MQKQKKSTLLSEKHIDALTKDLRANSLKLYDLAVHFTQTEEELNSIKGSFLATFDVYLCLDQLDHYEKYVSKTTGTIVLNDDFNKKYQELKNDESKLDILAKKFDAVQNFSRWPVMDQMLFVINTENFSDVFLRMVYSQLFLNIKDQKIFPFSLELSSKTIREEYTSDKIFKRVAEQIKSLILGLDIESLPPMPSLDYSNLSILRYDFYKTQYGVSQNSFEEIQKVLLTENYNVVNNGLRFSLLNIFKYLSSFMPNTTDFRKEWFVVMMSFLTLRLRNLIHIYSVMVTAFEKNSNVSNSEILANIADNLLFDDAELLVKYFKQNVFSFNLDEVDKTPEEVLESNEEFFEED